MRRDNEDTTCRTVSGRSGNGHVSGIAYCDLAHLLESDLNDPAVTRRAWDTLHLVTTVQGIVNRSGANLYIRLMPEPDDFWWNYLRDEHGWFSGRDVTRIDSIETLLTHFADALKGVVVYREKPWVGSNLASTIAGVEDRVALRYDECPGSVYQRVLNHGEAFTRNRLDLFDADDTPIWRKDDTQPFEPSGSDKRDAYLWLKRRYLDTGLVSKQYMGYYIDAYWLTNPAENSLPNCTLTNHDFFISQRAFFMDLHVWEEETPVDEPDQPLGSDLKTLRELLRAMHDHAEGGIIHIGGFTPWAWKYSSYPGAGSAHGGVDTEWKMVKEVSSYNALIDADALSLAGMSNASFYQHFPLEDHYPQNPRPKRHDFEKAGLIDRGGRVADKTYILLYIGDYDSAAWFNLMVPGLWTDPARGTIPCNWAFNPNLDQRAPHVMHYVRTHQSPNDWFITGDNGAGYLNPSMLTAPRPEPDMPDGWAQWVEHNEAYYDRYDLTITGFLIEGHSPGLTDEGFDAYMRFSPDGLVCHRQCDPTGLHRGAMPYVRHTQDVGGTPQEAAEKIVAELDNTRTQFLFFRHVIQTPTWQAEMMDLVKRNDPGDRVRFVDPYTFFGLLKLHEQQRQAFVAGPALRLGKGVNQPAET
ncbi:MAG: GxGYxYP family putative glycoside hydrolase [Phycisphaerales bacterium]